MRTPRSRQWLGVLASFVVLAACTSRKPTVHEQPARDTRWAAVDSLDSLGLYRSAIGYTDSLLSLAQREGDWRTEFRAWMYHGRLSQVLDDEAWPALLKEMEDRAATAPFPLQQLLHSVIGEFLWIHYRDDLWEIAERTEADEDATDPLTWGPAAFAERIIAHHTAALRPIDSLRTTPVQELGPLLLGDHRSIHLRPMLFDVLARRAVRDYREPLMRLAETGGHFDLNDPRHFALFEDFAYRRIEHPDSTAWPFQALRIQQLLERAHLSDDAPDALVDHTLARLAYVHENSTLSQKDTLLLHALQTLRTRVPDDSCWSEVTWKLAEWHAQAARRYDRLNEDPWKWEKRTAVLLCDSAIERFPGSFGARNAEVLRAELLRPDLLLHAEGTVCPEKPFKMAVSYSNAQRVWLRLVRDRERVPESVAYATPLDTLLQRTPLRSWTMDLPEDGDLHMHRVEIGVEALPMGAYALLISSGPDWARDREAIATATFTVSRLAVAGRREGGKMELLVMDRESGWHRPGVPVECHAQKWEAGAMRATRLASDTTDSDGRAHFGIIDGITQVVFVIAEGADRLVTPSQHVYRYRPAEPDSIRTHLFTDRAIYRPGQEVFFKGIVTVKQGNSLKVKEGYHTVVTFLDVHRQRVDTVAVVTDAFGAFTGRFTTPRGMLNGGMTLNEKHGTRWIRVEEYKRPTFEVVFDTIAGTPRLGDRVEVTGHARSYAGAPLDGAAVNYVVRRVVRLPWWQERRWSEQPWSHMSQVIAGEASCDSIGRFRIAFDALPDRTFPAAADPTFEFHIDAWVLDRTGEPQQGSTSVRLAQRAFDIELEVAEALDRSEAKGIHVRAVDLGGREVEVPLRVRIAKLAAPKWPLRKRQWERPDRFLMTREDHAVRFPQDPYDQENEETDWDEAEVIWRGVVNDLASVDMRRWELGAYRIVVEAEDTVGSPLRVEKVFRLIDPEVQLSGVADKAFHVEVLQGVVEPGAKAVLLVNSGLVEGRILMEIERGGRIVASKWLGLKRMQQRVELPVLEEDRGGFFVHFLCVEHGREHRRTVGIEVPWSNKQLHVEWMSFRDKLRPGMPEEWRLRLSGPKGEQMAAQVLTAMYDASLDRFVPQEWSMFPWPAQVSSRIWTSCLPFDNAYGHGVRPPARENEERSYPELNVFDPDEDWLDEYEEAGGIYPKRRRFKAVASPSFGEPLQSVEMMRDDSEEQSDMESPAGPSAEDGAPALRRDFRETAFFLPDLLTDPNGEVVLRFTAPEALTRWKLLGLAHTQDLKLATFTRTAVTQKALMVVPHLPRFLRAGDRITLTTKINVLEEGRAEGLATLELFDPVSGASLNKRFGLKVKDQAFVAVKGGSAVVEWTLTVPEGVDLCGLRITARSKGGPHATLAAADGEEHVLPVLTDKVPITESLPLWSDGSSTRTFELKNLKHAGGSTTLQHRSLRLEYTPDPIWQVVQALPTLMEFPHECAEQLFSRYYADRMAAHLLAQRPGVQQLVKQWQEQGADAFASALERNAALQQTLLSETPWVLNALDEHQRRARLALLFDLERMQGEERITMRKLRDMQLPVGAWPWWSGMGPNRLITQHIVAGFGHLAQLNALPPDAEAEGMIREALRWLDAQVVREHAALLRDRSPAQLEEHRPDHEVLHYLYARSFFLALPLDTTTREAVRYQQQQLTKHWLHYGLQEQALIALALHRFGDTHTAGLILASLRERAVISEELGMYWRSSSRGLSWSEFPVESHALLIEAFHEVAGDASAVQALRTHLLQLKRTTDWGTTKATADACHALLWTSPTHVAVAVPRITVGGQQVEWPHMEVGNGPVERLWKGAEVKPDMAQVTVSAEGGLGSRGALHWQYLEVLGKVPAQQEGPFTLRRQVLRTVQDAAGTRTVPLDSAYTLRPGDRLVVRLELRTDRWLDFVHLKDLRAAGLEPVDRISGARQEGGLMYYQSIRDAGMDFFFDRIAPGTHVLTYALRITHAGSFSNGLASVQCMYAPEFGSHSAGQRLRVQ